MEVAKPCLTGIPLETLDKIFKGFNYKEILHLRPICKHFKNYVDNLRPDFQHKYIEVNVITNGFMVHFGKSSKNGESENRKVCVEGDEYLWRPLETIIAHQKSTLGRLKLYSRSVDQEGYLKMLEKFEACLSTRTSQLKVVRFNMEARNTDQVLNILKYLDPSVLQSIDISFQTSDLNEKGTIEIQKFKELPCWKTLSGFVAMNFVVTDAEIEEFVHFKDFRIMLDTLKMSDVKVLKEKILESSMATSSLTIHYRSIVEDAELPGGHHSPIHEITTYQYPMPLGQNTHLCIELYDHSLHISIKNIRQNPAVEDQPILQHVFFQPLI